MELPLNERVAHLFRRFGLGATEAEVQLGVSLGINGTLNHLLDYEKVPEVFPPSPWEVLAEPKEGIVMQGDRIALWWALRMLTTTRPFEQKMMFFLHNHFALGGEKVEFVPMFVEYLETLRLGVSDHFPELLLRVSRDPAMIAYLDLDSNVRGRPNENFARELMELFTIGIGNYTEEDVMEASRAFTGWSCRQMVDEDPTKSLQTRLKEAILRGVPLVVSSFSPNLADEGVKTFRGKTGRWTAEQITKMLSRDPLTMRRILGKMWKFFGSDHDLTEKSLARLEKVYIATDGNLRAVAREIAALPEFWSPDCVRQKVKSPIDFCVSILRKLNLTEDIVKLRGQSRVTDPIPAPIKNVAYLLHVSLAKQGLTLLDPPDVNGWRTGQAWITPTNTIHRIAFADFVFAPGQKELPFCSRITEKLLKRSGSSGDRFIEVFCQSFDVPINSRTRNVLTQAFDKAGGLKSLENPERATYTLTILGRLIFGTPEYQLY